jgi:CheY-like chemotaxis protein
MRVLVCDDNRDAADTLAQLCAVYLTGAQIEICYNGDACIQKARAWSPDVLLLDIGMPGANGHEVARALRKMKECCNTYIVAISGWASKRDREASAAVGIDAHLAKPVKGDELFEMILSRT